MFLTLTYEVVPQHGTLVKKHFQDFMKRLRKSMPFDVPPVPSSLIASELRGEGPAGLSSGAISGPPEPTQRKIRFFHCGEYGDRSERPHYHAIIFGYWFTDSKQYKKSKSGKQLWTSKTLEKLWSHGRCAIGTVSYQSANYVARYIIKKITGDHAEGYYSRLVPDTGEVVQVLPEYITMSTHPGIGALWLEKYQTDVYPSDFVLGNGKKFPVPHYYDKLLRRKNAELLAQLKADRRRRGITTRNIANSKPARLAVRETVAKARAHLYTREPV